MKKKSSFNSVNKLETKTLYLAEQTPNVKIIKYINKKYEYI